MARVILVCCIAFIMTTFEVKNTTAILPRTKLLYAQAFRDGIWRGLAGDLAVVLYKPIRKGRFVYYYQKPLYYSKHHGYSTHGHGHSHHGGHGYTSYGVPSAHGGHGYASYGVPNGHGLHGDGHHGSYAQPAYPGTAYGYPVEVKH